MSVSFSDVTRALLDLVNIGWAKAYELRKNPPEEVQSTPTLRT
jgi:hypothetical protein